MKAKRSKKRAAEPVTYEVAVYRVHGVNYISVTTDRGPAAARQEAVTLILENRPESLVRLLPQEPRERLVAVLPGDFTGGGAVR